MLPPFEIHQPRTVEEAVAARRRFGDSAAVYAGGTELVLVMKEGLGAYEHLIDVKAIPDLQGLALRDGTNPLLSIGAAVTHRALARSAVIRERFPVLAEMESAVANARVRAVGTLGGNLAFAEPHSDPPTALLVHDATVALAGPRGIRTLPLGEFMRSSYETALEPDEILVQIDVPEPADGTAGAYLKFGLHERPTIGVAVLLQLDGARRVIANARVAVGCVGPVPVRLPALESALSRAPLSTLQQDFPAAAHAGDALDAVSDLHGSADYKRHLVGVFATRALVIAARRASERPPRRAAVGSTLSPGLPGDREGSPTAITMTVNGRRVDLAIRPEDLLLDVLRDRLGLRGSKRSCDVQVCGACTVLVDDAPVSSCSVLAYEARGRRVLTIEGLADGDRLHPLQKAFVGESAFQCGYCTPGMILASKAILDDDPDATLDDIREHLRGNICRCTGYVNILRAVAAARNAMAVPQGRPRS